MTKIFNFLKFPFKQNRLLKSPCVRTTGILQPDTDDENF